MSFEPQIDKENGSALGIVFIRYSTHEEAKRCVEKEDGKKPMIGMGMPGNDCIRVVLDGGGLKLKAVLKELESRKRQEKEERRRRENGHSIKVNTPLSLGPSKGSTPMAPAKSSTPILAPLTWRPTAQTAAKPLTPLPRAHSSLPAKPVLAHPVSPPITSPTHPTSVLSATPMSQAVLKTRRPPVSSGRGRIDNWKADNWKAVPMSSYRNPSSSSSTPIEASRGRRDDRRSRSRHHYRSDSESSRSRSRSRSPPLSKHTAAPAKHEQDHTDVVQQLVANGKDYVQIQLEGNIPLAGVKEEDVKSFFDGFKVEKVSRSPLNI